MFLTLLDSSYEFYYARTPHNWMRVNIRPFKINCMISVTSLIPFAFKAIFCKCREKTTALDKFLPFWHLSHKNTMACGNLKVVT